MMWRDSVEWKVSFACWYSNDGIEKVQVVLASSEINYILACKNRWSNV